MTTTHDSLTCSHCGLVIPVRRSRRVAAAPDGTPLFCCVGCRLAAAVGGRADGARRFLEARLLLSAFLAMGVMEFTFVLYGEGFYDAANDPSAPIFRRFGQFAIAMFAFPVMLLLGVPLMRGAWADLKQGLVRMDGLIVLGTVAAFALSVYHTIIGVGQVYYETATMVLVLVMFGRRLEAHARTQGREAAAALRASLPERAHRILADGGSEDVAVDTLRPGDQVRILPGETIPADVRVLSGTTTVVAAHLTGEERDVEVSAQATAPAGAINGHGSVLAIVERSWRDGGLGRILAHLDAPLPPTRLSRLVDRIASWLAWISIALAAGGGIRSTILHGGGEGLRTAISVLVVACPCALGLATPLAYRAVRAALARRGVLVRDPTALEVAPDIDAVLLDKTGTLTTSSPDFVPAKGSSPRALDDLRNLVAHSGHALGARLPRTGTPPLDLLLVPGAGVSGTIDGASCRAGSPRWLDDSGCTWPDDLRRARTAALDQGESVIAFARGTTVEAFVTVAQELRAGAREAVAALVRDGARVEIVSGDRRDAVARVAHELGIAFHSELLPEQKIARLTELRTQGHHVLAVGDGVNDAPILRAADVGVAIATGTAVARSQAQVEILGDDLRGLPRLIDESRRLRRMVYGNIVWTLIYNGVALVYATLGQLHPAVAAAAMVISSVVVSVRSYRLMDAPPAGRSAPQPRPPHSTNGPTVRPAVPAGASR